MARLALIALVVGLLGGLGSPTSATEPGVERIAWAQTATLATFVGQEDTAYVATTLGNEEARAFVQLHVAAATSPQASLVLPEATDGLVAEAATVVACALAEPFAGEGQIDGSALPAEDCSGRAELTRDDDGRWALPLEPFRRAWSQGAHPGALVLRPGPSEPTSTWRLALDTTAAHVVTSGKTPSPSPDPPQAEPTPAAPERAPTGPPTSARPPRPFPPAAAPGLVRSQRPGSATPPDEPLAPVVAERPAFVDDPPPFASAIPGPTPSAATPPAAIPLSLLGVVAGVGLLATPMRRRLVLPTVRPRRALVRPVAAATVLTLGLLPLLLGESMAYKSGLILIFVVAAVGLHLIVNWAGELSLAHAGMVGLPAFVSLALSEQLGMSPLYVLPVGVVAGGLVGALVALPTLRASGLRVALVTLAAGLAIDRFFFSQPWLVGGPGGRIAEVPSLGPLTMRTSLSLYPVLLVVVFVALVAAWVLYRSKVGRAWFWVRSDTAAASAFGIPVTRYRILAYAAGGAFAGLAGALTAAWVGQLTPAAFPTTLSFTYLMVAVLSGPGYVGGLAVAALALEGGRLFVSSAGPLISYLGPIALIIAITRQPTGLNGVGRQIMERLTSSSTDDHPTRPIGATLIGGVLAIAAGFVAITVAWYHAGNTDQVWIQNQEVLSGGIGGLALVIVGVGLLIVDSIRRVGARLAQQASRTTSAGGHDENVSNAAGDPPGADLTVH